MTSLVYKFYYNRQRPYQVDPENIKPLGSSKITTFTSSYPSSHALQSFVLAKHLTKQYPEQSTEIDALAERIADIRIIGGVHYPSDKEFARRISYTFNWL